MDRLGRVILCRKRRPAVSDYSRFEKSVNLNRALLFRLVVYIQPLESATARTSGRLLRSISSYSSEMFESATIAPPAPNLY